MSIPKTADQIREENAAEIARLKAENAELAAQSRGLFGLKLGTGGNIVVMGMGGKYNSVNLYPNQVETLVAHIGELETFAKVNAVELAKRSEIAKAKRKAEKAAKSK